MILVAGRGDSYNEVYIDNDSTPKLHIFAMTAAEIKTYEKQLQAARVTREPKRLMDCYFKLCGCYTHLIEKGHSKWIETCVSHFNDALELAQNSKELTVEAVQIKRCLSEMHAKAGDFKRALQFAREYESDCAKIPVVSIRQSEQQRAQHVLATVYFDESIKCGLDENQRSVLLDKAHQTFESAIESAQSILASDKLQREGNAYFNLAQVNVSYCTQRCEQVYKCAQNAVQLLNRCLSGRLDPAEKKCTQSLLLDARHMVVECLSTYHPIRSNQALCQQAVKSVHSFIIACAKQRHLEHLLVAAKVFFNVGRFSAARATLRLAVAAVTGAKKSTAVKEQVEHELNTAIKCRQLEKHAELNPELRSGCLEQIGDLLRDDEMFSAAAECYIQASELSSCEKRRALLDESAAASLREFNAHEHAETLFVRCAKYKHNNGQKVAALDFWRDALGCAQTLALANGSENIKLRNRITQYEREIQRLVDEVGDDVEGGQEDEDEDLDNQAKLADALKQPESDDEDIFPCWPVRLDEKLCDGDTRLHVAARCNQLFEMKLLIKREPHTLNARDAMGWTPLHDAIGNARTQAVQLLLTARARVNQKARGCKKMEADSDKLMSISPLSYACSTFSYGDVDHRIKCVSLLLRYGADPILEDANGWFATDHANAFLSDEATDLTDIQRTNINALIDRMKKAMRRKGIDPDRQPPTRRDYQCQKRSIGRQRVSGADIYQAVISKVRGRIDSPVRRAHTDDSKLLYEPDDDLDQIDDDGDDKENFQVDHEDIFMDSHNPMFSPSSSTQPPEPNHSSVSPVNRNNRKRARGSQIFSGLNEDEEDEEKVRKPVKKRNEMDDWLVEDMEEMQFEEEPTISSQPYSTAENDLDEWARKRRKGKKLQTKLSKSVRSNFGSNRPQQSTPGQADLATAADARPAPSTSANAQSSTPSQTVLPPTHPVTVPSTVSLPTDRPLIVTYHFVDHDVPKTWKVRMPMQLQQQVKDLRACCESVFTEKYGRFKKLQLLDEHGCELLDFSIIQSLSENVTVKVEEFEKKRLSDHYAELCNGSHAGLKFRTRWWNILKEADESGVMNLSRCMFLGPDVLPVFTVLQEDTAIKKLLLKGNWLQGEMMMELSKTVLKMSCLTQLDLRCTNLTGHMLQQLVKPWDGQHLNLLDVNLSYNQRLCDGSQSVQHLVNLVQCCPKLEHVALAAIGLDHSLPATYITKLAIALNELPGLGTLNVSQNTLGYGILYEMLTNALSMCHQLTRLDISDCALTDSSDQSMANLLALIDVHNICELRMSCCELDDRNLDQLAAQLVRCTRLQILDLAGISTLTNTRIAELLNALKFHSSLSKLIASFDSTADDEGEIVASFIDRVHPISVHLTNCQTEPSLTLSSQALSSSMCTVTRQGSSMIVAFQPQP